MTLRLTVNGSGGPQSWLVNVDDTATVAEVADAVRVDPRTLAGVPGEHAAAVQLSETELLNGTIVPAASPQRPPAGSARLEVVAGPFAGTAVPLGANAGFVIGSGAEAGLPMPDPYLLPAHLRVTVGEWAPTQPGQPAAPLVATVEPMPGAEVLVNGLRIDGPTRVAPIDVIQAASSIFRLGLEPAADADLTRDPRGRRAFNRPSRIRPDATIPVVPLPGDKPEDSDKSPLPWLSALIPVILGVTMAVVFNRPIMLLMAAASPIMVVGSYVMNRKMAKRKGERTEAQWIDDVNSAKRRIAELVQVQRVDAWYAHPDPLRIREIATKPLSNLWERRIDDPDALTCRVGVGEVPLAARFEGGSSKQRHEQKRVGVSPAPVTVNLGEGPVGVAGDPRVARATVRSLIASLVTLRSPRDLQLVALCGDDAESEAEWGWLQWLPHTEPGEGAIALVGNTDDTRRDRLRELSSLLELRRRVKAPIESHVVLLVDGARDLRRLPGMVDLLAGGAEHGIFVVALDRHRNQLPEECRSVLVVDEAEGVIGALETSTGFTPVVLLDRLTPRSAEEIARSLSSLEHVSGAGDEGMLPASVRYVELAGIDLDDPDELLARWNQNPRRTFVPVGATAESEFAVDLAADGPHALVAGTTGSGKSEFLQTLIISLALANRPDALNFVLIDYKGGSAFADCERLPHTVGMVTNLDARETERALASLDAELKRRERVLGRMGAKDVDAAWIRDPDRASSAGLARLVIVIDEFAELKRDLPAFIDGLVRIARVGRSLGVHLVLATQRPSGVVTPEMQSNISLRVALRVTDRSDSSDVLGSQEAAFISPSTPGRGYVRSVAGGIPAAFQTARVAGLRRGSQRNRRVAAPVAPVTWATIGVPPRFPSDRERTGPVDHDDTDLRALVNLAVESASRGGIARNPSPWLLPLPDTLTLDRFNTGELAPTEIVLGLQDVPAEQKQDVLTWDLTRDSHLLFLGGARSGRTTALRTILAQVINRYTPADAHIYVADYGNGAMLPLTDAQHCGAVVTPTDTERLPRLVQRLLDDLEHRQSVLSRAGAGSIAEQRRRATPEEALPYTLVAIDGWERLTGTLAADRLVVFREQVMRVLREGPSAGIRVMITADRTFTGDKVASAIDTTYVLPMHDPNDYRAAGVMLRELPSNLTPGRVLFDADAKEAQLAVLGRDTSGEAQTALFRSVIEETRDHFDRFEQLRRLPRAFRVDPLPSYIGLQDAALLPSLDGFAEDGVLVGVGGDELSRVCVDWSEQTGFVVAGSRASGRSSALASFLHQLNFRETPVIVIAPKPSILTELADDASIDVIRDTSTDASALLERVTELSASRGGRRVTLIVDDAELMKQEPIEFAITGVAGQVSIVAAVESEASSSLFGGALAAAKRARQGVVLTPVNQMVGTTLFGTQIPKVFLGGRSAGAGVVFSYGAWTPLRIADVRH